MLNYSRKEMLMERGEEAIASSAYSDLPKAALDLVLPGGLSSALPPAGPTGREQLQTDETRLVLSTRNLL